MSLGQLVASLQQKDSEKTGVEFEIKKFQDIQGLLHFSIYHIDGLEGKTLELDYDVTSEGDFLSNDSLRNKSMADHITLHVRTQELNIKFTCKAFSTVRFIESADEVVVAETDEVEEILEKTEARYTASMTTVDVPSDTDMRTELVAEFEGDSETLGANLKPVFHVKASYDSINSLISSKKLEREQLESEVKEIGRQIKEVQNQGAEKKATKSSTKVIKGGKKGGKKVGKAAKVAAPVEDEEDKAQAGGWADFLMASTMGAVGFAFQQRANKDETSMSCSHHKSPVFRLKFWRILFIWVVILIGTVGSSPTLPTSKPTPTHSPTLSRSSSFIPTQLLRHETAIPTLSVTTFSTNTTNTNTIRKVKTNIGKIVGLSFLSFLIMILNLFLFNTIYNSTRHKTSLLLTIELTKHVKNLPDMYELLRSHESDLETLKQNNTNNTNNTKQISEKLEQIVVSQNNIIKELTRREGSQGSGTSSERRFNSNLDLGKYAEKAGGYLMSLCVSVMTFNYFMSLVMPQTEPYGIFLDLLHVMSDFCKFIFATGIILWFLKKYIVYDEQKESRSVVESKKAFRKFSQSLLHLFTCIVICSYIYHVTFVYVSDVGWSVFAFILAFNILLCLFFLYKYTRLAKKNKQKRSEDVLVMDGSDMV